MEQVNAIPGESDLVLDELPLDAELPDVLTIIDQVHEECIAAVMVSGPATYHSPRRMNAEYPRRPRSGVPSANPRDGSRVR